MNGLLCFRHAIESIFTYVSWGYFYFSAGYFCCGKFNRHDINMRTFQQGIFGGIYRKKVFAYTV